LNTLAGKAADMLNYRFFRRPPFEGEYQELFSTYVPVTAEGTKTLKPGLVFKEAFYMPSV
jgi:hypothetical protein